LGAPRNICCPAETAQADAAMWLVTYTRVERQVFLRLDINFYTVHDVWPNISYHNVP
jgi:hypothetical protein